MQRLGNTKPGAFEPPGWRNNMVWGGWILEFNSGSPGLAHRLFGKRVLTKRLNVECAEITKWAGS